MQPSKIITTFAFPALRPGGAGTARLRCVVPSGPRTNIVVLVPRTVAHTLPLRTQVHMKMKSIGLYLLRTNANLPIGVPEVRLRCPTALPLCISNTEIPPSARPVLVTQECVMCSIERSHRTRDDPQRCLWTRSGLRRQVSMHSRCACWTHWQCSTLSNSAHLASLITKQRVMSVGGLSCSPYTCCRIVGR